MNFRVFLFAALLTVFSCTKEKQPKGILSKQDMVRVLTEIYIAEEKVQRMGVRSDSATRVFSLMNEKISQRTGIPDSVFRNSLRHYLERPKELEIIYTALVDSLNLMEQRSSIGAEAE